MVPGDGGMAHGLFAGRVAAKGHGLAFEKNGGEGRFSADGVALFEKERSGNLVGTEKNVVRGAERGALDAILNAIDGGAVARVEIFDEKRAVLLGDFRVMRRDHWVVEDNLAIG